VAPETLLLPNYPPLLVMFLWTMRRLISTILVLTLTLRTLLLATTLLLLQFLSLPQNREDLPLVWQGSLMKMSGILMTKTLLVNSHNDMKAEKITSIWYEIDASLATWKSEVYGHYIITIAWEDDEGEKVIYFVSNARMTQLAMIWSIANSAWILKLELQTFEMQ
jgi:hypothetical protein